MKRQWQHMNKVENIEIQKKLIYLIIIILLNLMSHSYEGD